MLKISREAQDVVRQIPDQPGHLPTAGLRIAGENAKEGGLHVQPSLKPRRGDTVVDFDGARVFLDAAAEARLDGRLLHVGTLEDGRLEFRSLAPDAA